MSVKPVPDGFHSVTPYLVVEDVNAQIEFMKKAFGAVETEKIQDPDGAVQHAEVKIGDSFIMLGQARDQYKPMPTCLYLYVEDMEALYKSSLAAGAESIMGPTDMFYGDRNAGVTDPQGNLWWIATHIEDVSSEELQRRASAQQPGNK